MDIENEMIEQIEEVNFDKLMAVFVAMSASKVMDKLSAYKAVCLASHDWQVYNLMLLWIHQINTDNDHSKDTLEDIKEQVRSATQLEVTYPRLLEQKMYAELFFTVGYLNNEERQQFHEYRAKGIVPAEPMSETLADAINYYDMNTELHRTQEKAKRFDVIRNTVNDKSLSEVEVTAKVMSLLELDGSVEA